MPSAAPSPPPSYHSSVAAISSPQPSKQPLATTLNLGEAAPWDGNSRFSPVPEYNSPLNSPSKAHMPYPRAVTAPASPHKRTEESDFDPPPPGALVSSNEHRPRRHDSSRPVSPNPLYYTTTSSTMATLQEIPKYYPLTVLPSASYIPTTAVNPPSVVLQTNDPYAGLYNTTSTPTKTNRFVTPQPVSRGPFSPPNVHNPDFDETPLDGADGLYMSIVKGVENPPGENHCFLNVIIQSLYRMPAFRDKFLKIAHTHQGQPDQASQSDATCVLCSLQTILIAYKISDTSVTINPSGFRDALAKLDSSVGRYQKADTAETYVLILEALHASIAPPDDPPHGHPSSSSPSSSLLEDGNFCTKQENEFARCLIHKTFDLSYLALTQCSHCDHFKSESHHSWFHYVNTFRLRKEWTLFTPKRFGQILYEVSVEKQKCPGKNCKAEISPTVTLTGTPPPVFTLCLVWPAAVEPDDIRRVLDAFDEKLCINDLFPSLEKMDYTFQGFVAFWGEHYVTYQTIHTKGPNPGAKIKRWVQFDDKVLRDLGSWSSCKEAIVRARMRPVIAWFVRDAHL